MKVNVRKFLAGGAPMPQDPAMAPEAAPMPAEGVPEGAPMGGEQPSQDQVMQQLDQLADEIIQQLGPEAAGALAEVIMSKIGGGELPLPAEEEQPVYARQGTKLVRIR